MTGEIPSRAQANLDSDFDDTLEVRKITQRLGNAAQFAVEQAHRADETTLLFPTRPSAESVQGFKNYLATTQPEAQSRGVDNA